MTSLLITPVSDVTDPTNRSFNLLSIIFIIDYYRFYRLVVADLHNTLLHKHHNHWMCTSDHPISNPVYWCRSPRSKHKSLWLKCLQSVIDYLMNPLSKSSYPFAILIQNWGQLCLLSILIHATEHNSLFIVSLDQTVPLIGNICTGSVTPICFPIQVFCLFVCFVHDAQHRQEAMGIGCDVIHVEIEEGLSKDHLLETFINCGRTFFITLPDLMILHQSLYMCQIVGVCNQTGFCVVLCQGSWCVFRRLLWAGVWWWC